MLWPHTDECDGTAKRGEGDNSHRRNTLELCQPKAAGATSPLSSNHRVDCPAIHPGGATVAEVTVPCREAAVYSNICSNFFTDRTGYLVLDGKYI